MNWTGRHGQEFLGNMSQIARTRQSGQTTVLVGLILTVLLVCVSIASDFGLFQNDRRKMRNAADSAAMAGEQEINAGNTGAVPWSLCAMVPGVSLPKGIR
jgi:Flp pilus assembly protein TadG